MKTFYISLSAKVSVAFFSGKPNLNTGSKEAMSPKRSIFSLSSAPPPQKKDLNDLISIYLSIYLLLVFLKRYLKPG